MCCILLLRRFLFIILCCAVQYGFGQGAAPLFKLHDPAVEIKFIRNHVPCKVEVFKAIVIKIANAYPGAIINICLGEDINAVTFSKCITKLYTGVG